MASISLPLRCPGSQKGTLKLPLDANCAVGGAQQLIHGATCARIAFRTDSRTKIRHSILANVCH
jgi:hypothetical protein